MHSHHPHRAIFQCHGHVPCPLLWNLDQRTDTEALRKSFPTMVTTAYVHLPTTYPRHAPPPLHLKRHHPTPSPLPCTMTSPSKRDTSPKPITSPAAHVKINPPTPPRRSRLKATLLLTCMLPSLTYVRLNAPPRSPHNIRYIHPHISRPYMYVCMYVETQHSTREPKKNPACDSCR